MSQCSSSSDDSEQSLIFSTLIKYPAKLFNYPDSISSKCLEDALVMALKCFTYFTIFLQTDERKQQQRQGGHRRCLTKTPPQPKGSEKRKNAAIKTIIEWIFYGIFAAYYAVIKAVII